jgi:hypothetical protein
MHVPRGVGLPILAVSIAAFAALSSDALATRTSGPGADPVAAVVGHVVHVSAPPSASRIGAHYRWQLVHRPPGSSARLKIVHSTTLQFKLNKLGYYKLRLTTRRGGHISRQTFVVASTPSYKPLGTTLNTITGQYGLSIQVGSYSHALNVYAKCVGVNAVIADRTTLAAYGYSLSGSQSGGQQLVSDIKNLISQGDVGSHPLVVLSGPLNNTSSNCRGFTSYWNTTVLPAIGAVAIPAAATSNSPGFSVVGVYGGAAGTAWQNDGSDQSGGSQGQIQGYLQNDRTGPFSFVPRQRIGVDLDAAGAPPQQNYIEVGGRDYPSGPLYGSGTTTDCNTGGFEVLELNAVTLASLSQNTFATNGCGTTTDASGETAMINYLQQTPSAPHALVLIQSIGTPYDTTTSGTLWQQLDTAVAGVGGTPSVLDSDTGSYSLIGSVGISSFPLAEASQTATGHPAHETAVLKRSRTYAYEPNLSSPTGAFGAGFQLAELAYQPSQSFGDNTPGRRAALAYISKNVLDLPTDPSVNPNAFCYVPAQLDVRYAYCYRKNWASYIPKLRGTVYPSGHGFSSSSWAHVVKQLAGPGYDEFKAVDSAWENFSSLLGSGSGNNVLAAIETAKDAAAQIRDALENSFQTSSAGKWEDLIGNLLNTVGAIAADSTAAGPINMLAAALYLSEDANSDDGAPALGAFDVKTANFAEALSTAYAEDDVHMRHVLDLILTDPGKLKGYYENRAAYRYSSDDQGVTTALKLGAARFAWQSLLPAAYESVDLDTGSDSNNQGVTNADNYVCDYNAGRYSFNYNPFSGASESGQLFNGSLSALVEDGADLPSDGVQETPKLPPSSLTDPLFEPYASNGGVITQFGMYKPWFYRQAYGLSSGLSVSC